MATVSPCLFKTDSPRLLIVPSACPSYGFAAIQCHLSSFGLSNRPVRVFPLDQNPRWLQSAGVRGKASSIKTGIKSDDVEYTGFKLCCKNLGTGLRSFVCSSNKYSRKWRGKHEEQRNKETQRESLFPPEPYLLFTCLSCFREGRRVLVPFLCLCMCACWHV